MSRWGAACAAETPRVDAPLRPHVLTDAIGSRERVFMPIRSCGVAVPIYENGSAR